MIGRPVRAASKSRFLAILLFLLLALIPCSVDAAGVTIITHGYDGDVTGWIAAMADEIPPYFHSHYPEFSTNFAIYTITLTTDGHGNYYSQWERDSGSAPADTDTGEIIVKLDWSQMAGDPLDPLILDISTYDVAAFASDVLLQSNTISELDGHPLIEFPIHFIGHSRGGSLISQMSLDLGANGVWIDHLTTLDPHPLNNDIFAGKDIPQVVDAPADLTYANVLFADNYWENLGDSFLALLADLDPHGEPVAGAYQRHLTALDGGYPPVTGDFADAYEYHSNDHLWYFGTVELNTPTSYDDDGTTVTMDAAMRKDWWVSFEQEGTNAGFLYSLIGGGNRMSTTEPVGPGYPAIVDGYNQYWDLGAGMLNPNRTALPANNGTWPNLIKFDLTGTNVLMPGETIATTLYYQYGGTSNLTLQFYLDEDLNPYNSNSVLVAQLQPQATGTNNIMQYQNIELPTTNVSAGIYSIYAKITDGTHTRYLYTPGLVQIGAVSGSLQVTILPQGAADAGAQWQVDGGTWENSLATVSNLSIGLHTISFDTISDWTSPAPQSLWVGADGTTTASGTYEPLTGSLKVTISPTSAITAGGKWQVDGGAIQNSGATVANLSVGNHTVSFNTISGWTSPASETVAITANSTATTNGTYVAIPPTGSLQVSISPAAATDAGAQWQVDGGNFQKSGATVTNLSLGGHTVSFNTINGWTAPSHLTVSIKARMLTKDTATYTFTSQGIYNGLFMQAATTEETAGMLSSLDVTASGTYSGKLLIAGGTNPIGGAFSDSGQASNYVRRITKDGGPLTLTMTLNWNDSPPNITGTVSGTNGEPWEASLTAEFAAKESSSAAYTALLPPAGTPPGYGYLLITNHEGSFVLSGSLADGTSFSQSVPLSGKSDLPIYGNLYGKTGLLLGWMSLESGSPAGNLTWIKKASRSPALYTNGFTNPIVVQGSSWTNPLPHKAAIDFSSGQLDISGGILLSPLMFNVAVSNNNALVKLSESPTNSLTGSINPKTGLLTITFGNGAGKATTTAKGAVLQNESNAGGFFLGKTNAGVILLQP
jgi:hypothetical protein